ASAALFTARARAAGHRGQLGAAEVDAVCRRCDGLPLAVELAAARLRTRGIDELADAGPRSRNLRAALAWAVADAPEEALRLVGGLGVYWHLRGHRAEGRRWAAAALAGPGPSRAGALRTAALLARAQGDDAPARALIDDAITAGRGAGDGLALADCLGLRAVMVLSGGDPQEGAVTADLAESMSRYRAAGSAAGVALTTVRSGLAALAAGDTAAAGGLLDDAVARYAELDSTWGLATARCNRADVHRAVGAGAGGLHGGGRGTCSHRVRVVPGGRGGRDRHRAHRPGTPRRSRRPLRRRRSRSRPAGDAAAPAGPGAVRRGAGPHRRAPEQNAVMTAHPADSTVYRHLWSTPELHEVFDDAGRTRAWLDILAALAEAQAGLGLVPADAATAIREHARLEMLDLDAVAEQTRATGHSTLGLIRCLKQVLPESAREWVYYGATVQDVSDTWFALAMRAVLDVVDRDVARCHAACVELARMHRDTVMCGRTHGQPGLPVTFGFKAAVWAAELGRHRERVAQARPRLEVVQLGGALGTLEFWGDAALPLLDAFAARLGLHAPEVPWITARDRVAEFATLLALVTGTLSKIGNEIYELQRPEIGEISEPFTPGQVGSITMPHKRNPELAEHLDTLGRVVRANAGLAIEGMTALHERDGRGWKAEWLVLPESSLLTGAALGYAARLLEGLQVHGDRMRANLDARRGYVLSEPVMRLLADRMGKHAAHEAVYAATMAGLDAGVDLGTALRDAGLVGPDGLTDGELAAALDPARALGAATAFVDRVVGGRLSSGAGSGAHS
ncbi:MAG: lyase family protein, partial [Pseudonocardia sp.]